MSDLNARTANPTPTRSPERWQAALTIWILLVDAVYLILYWPAFLDLFHSANRVWMNG